MLRFIDFFLFPLQFDLSLTPVNRIGNLGLGFQVVCEDKHINPCLIEKLREEREWGGGGGGDEGSKW